LLGTVCFFQNATSLSIQHSQIQALNLRRRARAEAAGCVPSNGQRLPAHDEPLGRLLRHTIAAAATCVGGGDSHGARPCPEPPQRRRRQPPPGSAAHRLQPTTGLALTRLVVVVAPRGRCYPRGSAAPPPPPRPSRLLRLRRRRCGRRARRRRAARLALVGARGVGGAAPRAGLRRGAARPSAALVRGRRAVPRGRLPPPCTHPRVAPLPAAVP
jgi:hypothetical protein